MRRNPKELKHTNVSHWVGFHLSVYVYAYFKASQQKILMELLFEIWKKKRQTYMDLRWVLTFEKWLGAMMFFFSDKGRQQQQQCRCVLMGEKYKIFLRHGYQNICPLLILTSVCQVAQPLALVSNNILYLITNLYVAHITTCWWN